MKRSVTVNVNGEARTASVDPRLTLVDFLRDELDLTGAHVGCRTGHCGACTVHLDALPVKSCCVLVADVDGQEVTTIESVARGGELHPVQQAFVDRQGLQCGYCTPGMVMSTVALLNANSDPSEVEIRDALAGNLCRCTGYQNIIVAVREAARKAQPR